MRLFITLAFICVIGVLCFSTPIAKVDIHDNESCKDAAYAMWLSGVHDCAQGDPSQLTACYAANNATVTAAYAMCDRTYPIMP